MLCDVPALRQQLGVGDGLLALGAALLNELLGRQLRLSELLRLLARLALLVRDNLKVAKVKVWAMFLKFLACFFMTNVGLFCTCQHVCGKNLGHFLAFAGVFVARKSQTSGRFLALANVFVASVLVSTLLQLRQQCTVDYEDKEGGVVFDIAR